MELWTTTVASARGAQRAAQEIEAAGWDGMLVVDSQNLSGDPYVSLALAATVTTRIGLGTGVTNSVTRQAAATATSIASVDRISNGRAVLGIGRGDSALAHLGRAPARLAQFELYLRQLQNYLSGEAVSFDDIDIPTEAAPPLSGLHLHDAPPSSRIGWIADGLKGGRKVPVEVAASGPKVIALSALHAERVMFTLGADTERLAWGIALAKKTRRDAGLDPNAIAFGAYVNLGCHGDMDAARGLVRGGLTTFARFSVMHGKASGPVSSGDRDVLEKLRSNYDMKAHTRGDSRQAGTLTDDFVDRFAIVGTPDRCIERLRSLAALGLDKVAISGGTRGASAEDAAVSKQLVAEQVLSGMRR
ncbi:MAG: LLM class flavin-dependent oxidoreductase [Reyranella sp.]|uniref:LLM class flavin-dependent oxidoreductase n=1 Tax=Reyranella sp. TaxID=1929291 RepID=UPI0027321F2C|nr:LLM class flavin-dependent oxidoreductase [Reyranella sp.]MDP1965730.1 LLM class flavin-dependent oxidoreductase [Reyranella sp.]MDP2375114.1 LLM class flavin-dependent oxidoreductase [Reyranella sp.]